MFLNTYLSSKATVRYWYIQTGHPSIEAITYLPNVAKGVEITLSVKGDNKPCKTCYLTTVKKQQS
jgi:hypothetical protein